MPFHSTCTILMYTHTKFSVGWKSRYSKYTHFVHSQFSKNKQPISQYQKKKRPTSFCFGSVHGSTFNRDIAITINSILVKSKTRGKSIQTQRTIERYNERKREKKIRIYCIWMYLYLIFNSLSATAKSGFEHKMYICSMYTLKWFTSDLHTITTSSIAKEEEGKDVAQILSNMNAKLSIRLWEYVREWNNTRYSALLGIMDKDKDMIIKKKLFTFVKGFQH